MVKQYLGLFHCLMAMAMCTVFLQGTTTVASNDLTTYGYGLNRYGSNPASYKSGPLAPLWNVSMSENGANSGITQPLVTTIHGVDAVIVGSEGGYIYAFVLANGTLLWKANLGVVVTGCHFFDSNRFGIGGTPAIDLTRSLVYVVGGEGIIFALHTQTGQIAWQVNSGLSGPLYNVYSALTIVDEALYVMWASHCDIGNYKGVIQEINLTTQKITASFYPSGAHTGAGIWGTAGLSYYPGYGMLVATGNSKPRRDQTFAHGNSIVLLQPGTLKVIKSFAAPTLVGDSDFGSTPLFVNNSACPEGVVFASNKNGYLYVLNAKSFRQVQALPMATKSGVGNFYSTAAYDEKSGLIFVSSPGNGNDGYKVGVYAFTLSTTCQLEEKWGSGIPGVTANNIPLTSPLISGGMVFVGTGQFDMVVAFNVSTGSVVWSARVPLVYGTPSVTSTGILLVESWDGKLYALK